MRVLGLITARAGSKGVPGKNVIDLAGRPLIGWTAALGARAREVGLLDRLIVSTDGQAIAEAARAFGAEVPFMRPDALAQDDTEHDPVLSHALDAVGGEPTYLALLQPTSPFSMLKDLDAALELAEATGADMATTVTPDAKPPALLHHIDETDRLTPILPPGKAVRRQVGPKTVALTGAVYVIRVAAFRRLGRIPRETSYGVQTAPERAIDIDTPFDLHLARLLAEKPYGELVDWRAEAGAP